MTSIVQLLTGFFVLLSLALIVTIPVSLATPGQWETQKAGIYRSTTLWTAVVFCIASANSVLTQ
nr:Photosystem II reaction center protein Z [Ishige okamurae]